MVRVGCHFGIQRSFWSKPPPGVTGGGSFPTVATVLSECEFEDSKYAFPPETSMMSLQRLIDAQELLDEDRAFSRHSGCQTPNVGRKRHPECREKARSFSDSDRVRQSLPLPFARRAKGKRRRALFRIWGKSRWIGKDFAREMVLCKVQRAKGKGRFPRNPRTSVGPCSEQANKAVSCQRETSPAKPFQTHRVPLAFKQPRPIACITHWFQRGPGEVSAPPDMHGPGNDGIIRPTTFAALKASDKDERADIEWLAAVDRALPPSYEISPLAIPDLFRESKPTASTTVCVGGRSVFPPESVVVTPQVFGKAKGPAWSRSLALLSLAGRRLATKPLAPHDSQLQAPARTIRDTPSSPSHKHQPGYTGPDTQPLSEFGRDRKKLIQLLYERLSRDLLEEISCGLKGFQTNVRNQHEALDRLDVRAHILEWLRRRREMTQGQEDAGTLEIVPVVLSESKNAATLQHSEIIRTEEDGEESDCADFIRRLYEKSYHNDAVTALRDGAVDFCPEDSSIVLGYIRKLTEIPSSRHKSPASFSLQHDHTSICSVMHFGGGLRFDRRSGDVTSFRWLSVGFLTIW